MKSLWPISTTLEAVIFLKVIKNAVDNGIKKLTKEMAIIQGSYYFFHDDVFKIHNCLVLKNFTASVTNVKCQFLCMASIA